MERRQINPGPWQDQFGFSQGWRIDGAQSLVFVAGQAAISPEGELIGEGDFEAQARLTFQNLQAVLEQAGLSMEAVVKLGVYLTDIGHLRDFARIRDEFVATSQPPASTAVEVTSLARPEMMIEVDAIAVG